MATRLPIDDSMLMGGIAHVCYEYTNLISAAHWSIHGNAPWRTHADDAFLLGYRKLRDFLLNDKRSTKNGAELPDILASDYLPYGSHRTWTLPTWESEWRSEMDKQLAHISFKRDKSWDHRIWVPRLEKEIRTAWTKFLDAVDAVHKAEFAAQLFLCRSKPGFETLTV